MSAPTRRPTSAMRLRHSILSEWRGLPEAPLVDLPAKRLDVVLGNLVKSLGLADRMRLEDVMSAWRTVAGDFVARQTVPESCIKGVLTVRVAQPSLHHAMVMEKPKLLQKLAEQMGSGKVREIKFRHG